MFAHTHLDDNIISVVMGINPFSYFVRSNVSVVHGGKLLGYINIEKSLVRVIMVKHLVSKSSLCVFWSIRCRTHLIKKASVVQ